MSEITTERLAKVAERYVWRFVPIIEPMEHRRATVYEHTPLDYYRYGEYPRFLRPVGAQQPRSEWKLVKA
jgi:hypothetical protein